MNRELKSFEIVEYECRSAFGATTNGDRVRENLPIIEEALIKNKQLINKLTKEKRKLKKALKIIKDKKVDMYSLLETLSNASPVMYNENIYCPLGYKLTQEEYELLKEVLL